MAGRDCMHACMELEYKKRQYYYCGATAERCIRRPRKGDKHPDFCADGQGGMVACDVEKLKRPPEREKKPCGWWWDKKDCPKS